MFFQEQLPEVTKTSDQIDHDLDTRIMTLGLLNGFLIGIVFYYILKRR